MNQEVIHKVIESLKRNKMDVSFFKTAEEAKAYIKTSIGENQNVGIGGSMTIYQMNLHNELKNAGNQVSWHWLESTPEDRKNAIERAGKADVYLTSANAITVQGEIVNVDGNGNRVASMVYGPKKVMIVCGVNKITNDLFEALERLRKEASPPNAKRLNRQTPCAISGECTDCNSPERICNITTIIHKKPGQIEMEVVLVGEELGY